MGYGFETKITGILNRRERFGACPLADFSLSVNPQVKFLLYA
jgi:hypothetical protein